MSAAAGTWALTTCRWLSQSKLAAVLPGNWNRISGQNALRVALLRLSYKQVAAEREGAKSGVTGSAKAVNAAVSRMIESDVVFWDEERHNALVKWLAAGGYAHESALWLEEQREAELQEAAKGLRPAPGATPEDSEERAKPGKKARSKGSTAWPLPAAGPQTAAEQEAELESLVADEMHSADPRAGSW